MRIRSRAALTSLVAAACLLLPIAAAAGAGAGPLSGTWSGNLVSSSGPYTARHHIVLSVNARETGGTWRLSAHCYGRLTLDSISSGYHHYLRHAARGTSGAGGTGRNIDCIKRAGPNLYDVITVQGGAAWGGGDGTLRRVRG